LTYSVDVAENLTRVRARIADAAARAGRDPDDVRLVAVSKTFPCDAVIRAWHAGQRDFGENRPEEGGPKSIEVRRRLIEMVGEPSEMPVWHMIGHVQSRKVDTVMAHFDYVHSLDRMKFARRLSRIATERGRDMPVLLECNVSGEASKYGYPMLGWERDEAVRQALFRDVAQIIAMPGLHIEGLMTMAPIVDNPESVRPVFASLRGLRDLLKEQFAAVDWRQLSMGMTDDFEIAVEEGATLVRIGRAIFGAR